MMYWTSEENHMFETLNHYNNEFHEINSSAEEKYLHNLVEYLASMLYNNSERETGLSIDSERYLLTSIGRQRLGNLMEWWYITALICLFSVMITGICCCLFAVYGIYLISMYRCPFGLMTSYKCTLTALLLFILFIWIFSCCIWKLDDKNPRANIVLGQTIMMLNLPVYISNVIISSNRMVTVAFPQKSRWFSMRNVKFLLLLTSLIGLAYSFLYHSAECAMLFSSADLQFHFQNTPCGALLDFYGDFVSGICIFTMCFLMDIVSIVYLRKMRKRVASSLATANYKLRYQKEMMMTIQTFINTVLGYLMICGYHLIPALVDTTTATSVFFDVMSSNFLWCLVLASGGYCAVLLNSDIREIFTHPIQSNLCNLRKHTNTMSPQGPHKSQKSTTNILTSNVAGENIQAW